MDNKFKEELRKLFPSLELNYLENITSKIAIVAQVRIGDYKNFTDYEEVSLINNNNEYGLIEPSSTQTPSLPADYNAVHKHALKKGDLLLSYRAKNRIKVLRVKDTPQRAMVGNTSTIRIEFYDNSPDILPVLVQSYLNLDIVQEYLISLATKKRKDHNTKRFLISPSTLRDLPIPIFKINDDMEYEKIFMERFAIYSKSKELLSLSKNLCNKSGDLLDSTLLSYENNSHELPKQMKSDKLLMDKIEKIRSSIEDMLLELEVNKAYK